MEKISTQDFSKVKQNFSKRSKLSNVISLKLMWFKYEFLTPTEKKVRANRIRHFVFVQGVERSSLFWRYSHVHPGIKFHYFLTHDIWMEIEQIWTHQISFIYTKFIFLNFPLFSKIVLFDNHRSRFSNRFFWSEISMFYWLHRKNISSQRRNA